MLGVRREPRAEISAVIEELILRIKDSLRIAGDRESGIRHDRVDWHSLIGWPESPSGGVLARTPRFTRCWSSEKHGMCLPTTRPWCLPVCAMRNLQSAGWRCICRSGPPHPHGSPARRYHPHRHRRAL